MLCFLFAATGETLVVGAAARGGKKIKIRFSTLNHLACDNAIRRDTTRHRTPSPPSLYFLNGIATISIRATREEGKARRV